MEESIYVVNNDGIVDLYRDGRKAREEWLAIVETIRENKYYHSSFGSSTKVDLVVDVEDTHYCIFIVTEHLGKESYKSVCYGLHKIK